MKFSAIVKAWCPVVLWMALMFLGSTDALSARQTSRFLVPFLRWLDPDISFVTIAWIHYYLRKAAHVTEYAILAGLLFRALRWSIDGFWWRAAFALFPALIYAPLDEFHQSFVSSRTPSPGDVLVDYSGAIAGILICWGFHLARARAKLEHSRPAP